MIAYAILALVVVQRLAELACARHNTRALLAKGAVEIGREHYPLFVFLHAAWLITIALALPKPAVIQWIPLCGYIALEVLRAWTMLTLGPYWTTRIISLADAPLVRRGPYRFVRHPNYVIVIGEIALLPLVFGEVWVAATFSILNAMLLFWRVREEESALAPRRAR
ncbi:MAG TPA: isoprenylcysteine carboxylmethyltransferase family protein [Rhizomicrobium sp.]|jgi:methyltransferase|nr:isoprenylcysteine carboxylmethyltransferase family protein [Rhizomicrobium sp.]